MSNFRIRALGNRQQHTFAGEDWNVAALHHVMRWSDFLRDLQQRRQFAGTRERLALRRGTLGRPRPLPLRRFFVAVTLLVVELDPVMPALRADAANLLQIFLDAVLLRPIFRKP